MIRVRMVGHGWAELRAHPWRAALSGLSLSIGVLAVVAIFTVGAITAEVKMLVSAMIVGIAAASVAVLVAWVGVQWWVPQRIAAASAISPPGLPWTAVGWGVAAAVITTVAGSLIPALVAARLDVATALRD